MSDQARRDLAPAGATLSFVLACIALAVATFFASFMGRFLSFGGLETTQSEAAFNALMVLAVYGPFAIALVCIVWGISRLVNGKQAWWTAGVGLVALLVNFNVAAAAIGS